MHQTLKEPNSQQIRVRKLGELLDTPIPDRKPILGSWLDERHLSMVYAPAGVGKSMFTMSIALAVAGGGSYLGWKAPEPKKVLIVDGEMDIADLQERAKLLMDALTDIDDQKARTNLYFMAQQDQDPGTRFPDITTPEGQDEVISRARMIQADLVILDNFSTLANVEDENKASSFNPVIELLRNLKLEGASCILVHHSRKGNKGQGTYRGTSKMAVIFNSIIALNFPDGLPSTKGAAFDLEWDKFRNFRDETVKPLKVKLDRREDGSVSWEHEIGLNDQILEVLALLKTLQYSTQKELADAMDVSTGTLSKLKGQAIAENIITSHKWKEYINLAQEEKIERLQEENLDY